MGEDGIDLLARLEKLEKIVAKLTKKVAKLQEKNDILVDITRSWQDEKDNPETIVYTNKSGYVCDPPCDHNYPRLESIAGKTCSNCGKVMELRLLQGRVL
jgi:hypothetical protein